MRHRARRARRILRNRRRGIMPYALLKSDDVAYMKGIRHLHPAEALILYRALQRSLVARFLPDEREAFARIFLTDAERTQIAQ
jgi:hypothetical protein